MLHDSLGILACASKGRQSCKNRCSGASVCRGVCCNRRSSLPAEIGDGRERRNEDWKIEEKREEEDEAAEEEAARDWKGRQGRKGRAQTAALHRGVATNDNELGPP